MGLLRKTLSIILGSSEETLVTAKTELSRTLGDKRISNDTEKNYILDMIAKDVIIHRCYGELDVEVIVMEQFNNYLKSWNRLQLQMLNRVLVCFYGYKLGDINTLPIAIKNLTFDLKVYKNV
ncbi:hypothetical protein [Alkaliphilus hydrothermalis]|uniref:Uncharacterized protein n=1 Tax=Alkaliphilus hydrothermalis TaxID=1482730 RepID=A0ABS2NML2_9FIRM|nr:hypothetical protein [Alkaliphilus hydrothermalis]MBM7614142.1 hypothetical protein [Alkaliphilus hydrothermalis]